MNIYINSDLHSELSNSILSSGIIGSSNYGLNDSKSDTDILHIYATSNLERNFMFNNIHQLQYKNNNDYLYTSLHTFISNIIRGDSTINFEYLHREYDNTLIDSIRDIKHIFYTYSVAKSYIGLAKRDYKYFHKRNNQRDIIKGILHIKRGILTCKEIMNYWKGGNKLVSLVKEELILLKNEYTNELDIKTVLSELNREITETYSELNNYYDNNKKYVGLRMKTDNMLLLQNCIDSICSNNEYINKSSNTNNIASELLNLYSDAYENWITY